MRAWWRRLWSGEWSQNRLMSRKFLLTLLYILGVWAIVLVVSLLAGLTDAPLIQAGVYATGTLLGVYLGVQGARDWKNHDRNDKHGSPGGDL